MDVTALVESHHLNQPLVQQVLSKYYVRHTQAAAQAAGKGKGKGKGAEAVEDFSWAEGGFIRTVQRRTLALLGETRAARGPSMEMRVIVWLTLLAWAVAFGAMCVVRASTWLPALVAGFFLYGLLGIGHNGMHTAHPWRYLMDLSLFSHAEWTVSHCLSHHHWPNTQVDFEISAIEPFIWSLASKAGHKHRYLPLYLWGVLCILVRVMHACTYPSRHGIWAWKHVLFLPYTRTHTGPLRARRARQQHRQRPPAPPVREPAARPATGARGVGPGRLARRVPAVAPHARRLLGADGPAGASFASLGLLVDGREVSGSEQPK